MIKEQCSACRKNNTQDCGQVIVYNSSSCEHYVKRIDLTKSGDSDDKVVQETPESETVSYDEQELTFWNYLFSFKGRIRRTRYWLTSFGVNLLFLPANLSGDNMSSGIAIYTLVMFVPAIWIIFANVVKRCHDLGKSGWLGLLLIVPLINIGMGIYLAWFKGDEYDNEYGKSPY